MKICLIGFQNLPVLLPELKYHTIGGESVQQSLLAHALVRRGHDVRMVSWDYGQPDEITWKGIRVYKAFRPDAGLPLLRFVHPRWTGLWSALKRADADLYYTSCAGMHVGLLALFCKRYRRRFVFRSASDSDCDPSQLLVRYARDRWLYGFGLRRADAILVQSKDQAERLAANYGLPSRIAWMLVDQAESPTVRDIDLLWVSNIRQVKRPDRILELAKSAPETCIHMVGGALPGEDALFREISHRASGQANVVFHGRLSYADAGNLYSRARLFVNTSDVEGFPNAYLQAWVRGVPVVTLIDPDRVIDCEGLGIALSSSAQLGDAVRRLLDDPVAWQAASERCRAYMAREYGDDRILAPYLETFEDVMCRECPTAQPAAAG